MHQDIDIAQLMRQALSAGRTTASLGRELGLSQPTVSRMSRGLIKPARSLYAGLRLIELVGGTVTIPDAKPQQHAGDEAIHAP